MDDNLTQLLIKMNNAINEKFNKINSKIESMEKNINKFKKDIDQITDDISLLRVSLNTKVDDIEDRIMTKIAKTKPTQSMDIIKAREDIKKEIIPQINRVLNLVKYNTLDGDQLVTEYRK